MGVQFFETMMGRQFFEGRVPQLIKAIERVATALEAQAPAAADAAALDAIASTLSGQEWDADTLVTVADAVRKTGRVVDDVEG
jgi:hypothetical protein